MVNFNAEIRQKFNSIQTVIFLRLNKFFCNETLRDTYFWDIIKTANNKLFNIQFFKLSFLFIFMEFKISNNFNKKNKRKIL